MRTVLISFVLLSVLALPTSSRAQYNQQRGVVLGGLTGAAAGAIIGENSDEAGAGAAIGGVVGALAGSVLGNAEDQRARAQYVHQQRQAYAQQQYYASRAVTFHDVVAMSRSGVSDHVVITAIQQRGLQGSLEVSDIVQLSQNGVSDNVIRAMQQVGNPTVITSRPVVTRPAPTVVVRPAPSRYYPSYGRPHYRAHNGPRGYYYR